MILIAHRGNLNGPCLEKENEPEYLDLALERGFQIEVDIWVINDLIYLGHDLPTYLIDIHWLKNRVDFLWVHCKNLEAMVFCYQQFARGFKLNYFWHETDAVTLTSKGFIWAYPGKQPISGSIAVMPELNNDSIDFCLGICSDFVSNYN